MGSDVEHISIGIIKFFADCISVSITIVEHNDAHRQCGSWIKN